MDPCGTPDRSEHQERSESDQPAVQAAGSSSHLTGSEKESKGAAVVLAAHGHDVDQGVQNVGEPGPSTASTPGGEESYGKTFTKPYRCNVYGPLGSSTNPNPRRCISTFASAEARAKHEMAAHADAVEENACPHRTYDGQKCGASYQCVLDYLKHYDVFHETWEHIEPEDKAAQMAKNYTHFCFRLCIVCHTAFTAKWVDCGTRADGTTIFLCTECNRHRNYYGGSRHRITGEDIDWTVQPEKDHSAPTVSQLEQSGHGRGCSG